VGWCSLKRFFLLLLSLLIIFPVVSSLTPPTGGVSYYNFSSTTDLWGGNDATNNGATSVTQYPSFNISGDSSPNSFSFDGTSDYVTLPISTSSTYSLSAWVNLADSGTNPMIYDNRFDAGTGFLYITGGNFVASSGTIYKNASTSDVSYTYGEGWAHVVVTGISLTGTKIYICSYITGATNLCEGHVDEIKIYNRTLSSDEVENLYNYGSISPTPTPDFNHYTDSVSSVLQSSSVSGSSSSYFTVVNGSFNVENATSAYFSWVVGLETSSANVVDCRGLLNGAHLGSEVSRSFASAGVASVYLTSEVVGVSSGSNELALQCRESAGTTTTVFNSSGLLHELISEGGDNLTFAYSNKSYAVSSASPTYAGGFVFNTSNVSSTGLSRNLVLDGSVEYNYSSSGLLDFYVNVSGDISPVFTRYGLAGSAGSGASFTVSTNVSANQSLNVSLFTNGSASGDLFISLVAKEIILNSSEINSSSLSGSFSDSWTNISTLRVDNKEHLLAGVLVKASVSAYSNSGTQEGFFRIVINGSDGVVRTRTLQDAGRSGVVILQDDFEDLPFGSYDVSLQARSENVVGGVVSGGSLVAYLVSVVDFTDSAYLVNASDFFDGSPILSFNVTDERGVVFSSNSSGVASVTPYQSFEDLDISSDSYISRTYSNHDVLDDLEVVLTPVFFFNNVYLNNFFNYSTNNYTNNLTFLVEYVCESGRSATFNLLENGSIAKSFSATCNSNLLNTSSFYQSSSEGLKNVSFNWSVNNQSKEGGLFIYDLFAPSVSSFWGASRGFNNNSVSGWFYCDDSVSPVGDLSSFWNGGLFYNSTDSLPSNVSFSNVSSLGDNTLRTRCVDVVGLSAELNDTRNVFSSQYFLINEQNGSLFDVGNLSSVVVYVDENSLSFDLKAEGANSFNFSTTAQEVLRFEYIYSDGFILNRYVDVSLLSGDYLNVCVPPDNNLQFYEKIFISSTDDQAMLFNALFADCTVLLDFTRFAYQDAFSLRTFTIDTSYRLFTEDSDGDFVILASIDGGFEAFINLDTLEFSNSQVPVSLQPETLVVEKVYDSTLLFVYNNTGISNEDLSFTITRTDTGAVVYSDSSFVDKDSFVLFWDFSSLTNVSDVLFKATVQKTDVEGAETSKSVFFNTDGQKGLINPKVAFAISFFLLLFGFTFTTANVSLSWLGFVICIGVLGILSASLWTYYILLLGAIDIFIMVYIVILMNMQTSRAVVT